MPTNLFRQFAQSVFVMQYGFTTQKQTSCKKIVAPFKMASVKKFWNIGGGQEIAVMVGQWQKF